MRQSWTKEKVRDMILGLHKTSKINSGFIQLRYPNLYQRALHHFGSWQNAVEAAGINYLSVRARKPFRKWTKKAVIEEIKRRRKNNLPLNGSAVSRGDRGLYHAAKRLFGSKGWDKALCQVGLNGKDLNPSRIWTRKKVVEEIRKLHQAGVNLNCSFLVSNGYANLYSAGYDVFGSWEKAIAAAGLNYENIRKVRNYYWTKKRIIKEIRRLNQLGVRLSSKTTQNTRCDLFRAAINKFGCWSQAVEAAGINYQEHCLLWSTKAWLRKMTKVDAKKLERRAETLSRKMRKK